MFLFLWRYILKSRLAGSSGNFMFKNLQNCQTILQSGCDILKSHQQYQFFHILLILVIVHLFYFSHPRWHEVISPCDFDLHFPNDQCYCASYHMIIGQYLLQKKIYSNLLFIFKLSYFLFFQFQLFYICDLQIFSPTL